MKSLLTDEDLLAIAFAAEASGPKDDEAMEGIIAWAERILFNAEVLKFVMDGTLILDWDPVAKDVRFKITEAAARGRPDA